MKRQSKKARVRARNALEHARILGRVRTELRRVRTEIRNRMIARVATGYVAIGSRSV